ncbi:MAG: hypothetical protein GY762_13565 [Proteobacteria bacterium]|nr:hypothetical protein [Pseudomonadota bacterium]
MQLTPHTARFYVLYKYEPRRERIVRINIGWLCVVLTAVIGIISGCDSRSENELANAIHAPAPLEMKLASMVAGSALRPGIVENVQLAPSKTRPTKGNGKLSGGEPIDDDVLIGSYACEFHAKELPLGPFKLGSFGCRVIKDRDGVLQLISSSGIASLKGTITKLGAAGFSIIGNYKFPGNRLHFRTTMEKNIVKKATYKGNGLGMMNENGRDKKFFSFIMIKEYK